MDADMVLVVEDRKCWFSDVIQIVTAEPRHVILRPRLPFIGFDLPHELTSPHFFGYALRTRSLLDP